MNDNRDIPNNSRRYIEENALKVQNLLRKFLNIKLPNTDKKELDSFTTVEEYTITFLNPTLPTGFKVAMSLTSPSGQSITDLDSEKRTTKSAKVSPRPSTTVTKAVEANFVKFMVCSTVSLKNYQVRFDFSYPGDDVMPKNSGFEYRKGKRERDYRPNKISGFLPDSKDLEMIWVHSRRYITKISKTSDSLSNINMLPQSLEG